MDERGIKTSQRVSRSCIECGRRKIKCDKKIPCQPCIRRNVAHECRRPLARVRGQLTVYSDSHTTGKTPDQDSEADAHDVHERLDALTREHSALLAHIAELETALALSKPCAHSHVSATGKGDEPFPPSSLEDIVPAFERFDLDIEQEPSAETIQSSEKETAARLYAPSTDPIFLLLPNQSTSHELIHFSLRTLGWLHCAVNADAFIEEHDEFWYQIQNGTNVHDRPWLAVYMALLAVGILYLDPGEIPAADVLPQIALPSVDPVETAVHTSKLWYEASLKEIEAHGFSGKASLSIVQALSVLTLCHANFGEGQREWLFTGFAVNMAKCLEMHRLGSELACSEDLRRKPQWCTPEQRELGRRLWWSCIIRDWLGGWNRPPSISPASFCCQFTTETKIEDKVMPSSPYTTPQTNGESVLGPPSPIHYHFAMSRLAYVFYIYIKANTHHTPSKFSKAIEEITTVRTNLPLHLTDQFPATQDDEQWELEHPWVPFQRFLLTQVIDFMLLSIARVLAVKELGANTSKYRHVALESATRILRNYSRPVPRTYKLVWVVSASTVAAAIYTALHTLATRADGQGFSRLQVVELLTRTAAELKSHAAVANHAAHGSNTIQNLLQVMAQKEAGIPEDPGSIHDVLRQVSSLCSVQSSPFAHDFAQQAANMDLVDIADLDAILNDGDSHFAGPMDTWDDLWMGF